MKVSFLVISLIAFSFIAQGQDHGSITYQNKTVQLTGYRTRISQDKRWVIAEGKADGKLYSITATFRPDVVMAGDIQTDAKHSLTLTISNLDYTNAQNFCFDGGSKLHATLQNGKLSLSGTGMAAGNCFGSAKSGDKLNFVMKP